MTLHEFLDWHYGADGDTVLPSRLANGEDVNARHDVTGETPLHVATRRRRESAVAILLEHGAEIDALNGHEKTAFAHALRRGFHEVATLLESRGAKTDLNDADRFAVAVTTGNLDEAKSILAANPNVACTGNPEEDRLLADVAGRQPTEPVVLLIQAGANLAAPALDGGAALHQAAWFGQPANARLLIDAGAPLDDFNNDHQSSPLGWAVHGSRYSGGAEERQDVYIELITMLLDAGSSLQYPDQPGGEDYWNRLLNDASPRAKAVLQAVDR